MIISNAMPLIAFARIGRFSLLRKVVGGLIIPGAVADEISGYTRHRKSVIDLQQEHDWIKVQSVQSDAQVQLLLPALDRGEAEVIALALERQARLVLIDDLAGRKVAESLNLNVAGSVGILIRAKQMGEIPAVKPLLDKMKQQGIYFSQRFMDAVLREIKE